MRILSSHLKLSDTKPLKSAKRQRFSSLDVLSKAERQHLHDGVSNAIRKSMLSIGGSLLTTIGIAISLFPSALIVGIPLTLAGLGLLIAGNGLKEYVKKVWLK